MSIPARPFEWHLATKATRGAPTECWVWRGYRNAHGYGEVRLQRRGPRLLVHRAAWAYWNNASPCPWAVVRHKCDNPPCVNPAHLEIGTQADNVRDMDRRGRRRCQFTTPTGEARPATRLPDNAVGALRAEYAAGVRQVVLAQRYGIGQSQVSRIVRRESRRRAS